MVLNKVCLVVIDGWGHNTGRRDWDAIDASACRWMRWLSLNYPSYLLSAHGSHVGLLPGLMGNSEVGHLTIGAGRVVEQDILRIGRAVEEGRMASILSDALGEAGGRVHVVGMLSDGGVHSHISHLRAILKAMEGRDKVYIHCIGDGRDTASRVFLDYFSDISSFCRETGVGETASVAGRFYTMDRANNDDRVSRSFDMMTRGGIVSRSVDEQVKMLYSKGLTDETLLPFLVCEDGRVREEDTVLFFNFRADRMRQIVDRFIRNGNRVITMTEYKSGFDATVLFERQHVKNTVAEVLSSHGIQHVHIAEREKQAHVTYFFNGGREMPFPHQKVVILPSPNAQSFDSIPEMASREVAKAAVEEMEANTPFVVANLAPPDMVGHTGNFEATRRAVEATDECIGVLYESCMRNSYVLVVTADHGNAEKMKDAHGDCCKTHTTNKVPLIVCKKPQPKAVSGWGYTDCGHSLRDVAPTALQIMGISVPAEMTGRSVLDE